MRRKRMKPILHTIYTRLPYVKKYIALHVCVCILFGGVFYGTLFAKRNYAETQTTLHVVRKESEPQTSTPPLLNTATFAYAANTQTLSYGKARARCNLYKTADVTNNESYNIFFEVPETYFVEIMYEQNGVYKVNYNQTIGYVLSQSIEKVSFTPQTPVLEGITFTLKEGTQLRSTPMVTESNITCILPANVKLTYIAQTHGDASGGTDNDVWYYCHYSPTTDPTIVYTGYVYSARTQNLTHIPSNTETNPETQTPNNPTDTQTPENVFSQKWVLLLVSLVPCVLVGILLLIHYKKRKNATNINQNNANFEQNAQNFEKIPLTATRAEIPAEYTMYPTTEHGKLKTNIKNANEKPPKMKYMPTFENTPSLPEPKTPSTVLQTRTFTAKRKHDWYNSYSEPTLKDIATERKEKHRFIEQKPLEDF